MKINIESWNNFGYSTGGRCCVCGETPAKVEPRFGYPVCIECFFLSPAEVAEERVYFDDEPYESDDYDFEDEYDFEDDDEEVKE